jgi:hypothetical protein
MGAFGKGGGTLCRNMSACLIKEDNFNIVVKIKGYCKHYMKWQILSFIGGGGPQVLLRALFQAGALCVSAIELLYIAGKLPQ